MKKILLSILLTIILSSNVVFADATSECNNLASYTMGINSIGSSAINECKNNLNQYSSSELSTAFSQCKSKHLPQLEAWGADTSSGAFSVIYKCVQQKVSSVQYSPSSIYINTYSASNDNDWNKLFLNVIEALSDHTKGTMDSFSQYVDSMVELAENTADDILETSHKTPMPQSELSGFIELLESFDDDILKAKNDSIKKIDDDIQTLKTKKIEYLNEVSNGSFILEVYSGTYEYLDESSDWIGRKYTEGSGNLAYNVEFFNENVVLKKSVVQPTTTSTNNVITSPTVTATKIFKDITPSHKQSNAIAYLKKTGYIGGYDDGSFKPENTVNRAELLKILIGERYNTAGYNNCFKDVKDEWFAPYVCYAKAQGWISGYTDGTFKPAQTVNRAEAIKMAIEVFGLELPSVQSNPFSDVDKSTWFAPYVQIAKVSGLFDNSMTSYGASNGMKRGDISDIIYRLLAIKKLGVNEYSKSLDSEMTSK